MIYWEVQEYCKHDGNMLDVNCFINQLAIYVTGFAKRSLPHTSNIPTLIIHNFRLVDLKFGQYVISTAGTSFSFVCLLIMKLWSSKFIQLDVCGRPLFANPVTYI